MALLRLNFNETLHWKTENVTVQFLRSSIVLPNAKTPIELVSALLYFLAKYTTDIGSLQLKQWPNLNTYYLLTLGIATRLTCLL